MLRIKFSVSTTYQRLRDRLDNWLWENRETVGLFMVGMVILALAVWFVSGLPIPR